jgi:hypothetical protein
MRTVLLVKRTSKSVARSPRAIKRSTTASPRNKSFGHINSRRFPHSTGLGFRRFAR